MPARARSAVGATVSGPVLIIPVEETVMVREREEVIDPLTGEQVEVLWVKGSGGDIGSMGMDGFATLYMDKLRALKGKYRGVAHEDEMVGYLPHCTFALNPRAASIDTPLHAYVPKRHVDHVHSDAIIAIAASVNSRELTAQIFGDEIGWLPWKKPGYELGLWLEKLATENPQMRGAVLEHARTERRRTFPAVLHVGIPGGPARTFLIDPEGLIKVCEIHDNGIGRDASELLRKVKAALYVASHPGEVCPAKWKEGAETLKPSLDLVGKI